MNVHAILLLLLATFGLMACRNPASPPPVEPPPVVEAPSVTCPATVVADVQVAPAAVQFPAPAVTGGTQPVTTSCSLQAGSSFPVGETSVTCTATDSLSRTAQCSFQVRVNVIAKLKGTKFLAFGDSLTEGEVSAPVPGSMFRIVDKANSYPTVLLGLLKEKYPLQASAFTVDNKGIGGLQVTKDEQRFADEVRGSRPDVVLLLHGTNDLTNVAAPLIAESIGNDVVRAFNAGVKMVFVSTLLPQVVYRGKGGHPEAILEANEEIRATVARLGANAVLVDSFAVFNPLKEKLIGEDGLHPTIDGYQLLAETFLAAIKSRFEEPPVAAASLFRVR